MPADKQISILHKLQNFRNGDKNVITGRPKKTKFLYSAREIASLIGSLVHFTSIHHELKPYIVPFFRLFDNYQLTTRHSYRIFKRLNITRNKWLQKSLDVLTQAVQTNAMVPFAKAARHFGKPLRTVLAYADAAGEPEPGSVEPSYGMGGYIPMLNFAWQCKRDIYLSFLLNAGDTQTKKDSINSEELLAQQLQKWLMSEFLPSHISRLAVWCFCDNKAAYSWLRDNTAVHGFQASLVSLSSVLEFTYNMKFFSLWCSTDSMKHSGADELSRVKLRFLNGCKVLQVSRKIFLRFKAFHAGMAQYYFDMLKHALIGFKDTDLLFTTASFASFARQNKTNNAKITNAIDIRNLAERKGLLKYLPKRNISHEDAATAVLAATCAAENFYAPKTIATKVYSQEPFVNRTPSNIRYPFTSLVIKGIRRLRSVEETVGVVLGKDILDIFNSSLQPTKYYFDLLLVTFD